MSLLRLTVLACSAALAGTLSVAPAHADPVGPGPLDPVIGALPAAPVPYTPYDGPVCADGDPQCIDDVIAEMEDRLAPLAAVVRPRRDLLAGLPARDPEREGRGRLRLLRTTAPG